ncbi:MAG: nucleotidyltransferase [Planctomycetota bacterium]|nr:MAG: nucleotidyltransferase [Planctomycetota bacterium]
MNPTLVVLAAGMGSRYGGLKQIDPVGPSGEFILDYSIYDAIKAGFDKVVFIIRKDIEEEFHDKVGSRYKGKIEVSYTFQELDLIPEGFSVPEGRSKPWGTGHALLMAKEVCNGPFVVLNADDFYGFSSFQLMADHFKNFNQEDCVYGIPAYLLCNTLSEFGAVARGVCDVRDGFLIDIIERTHIEKNENKIEMTIGEKVEELPSDKLVSMNMWGLFADFFKFLEDEFVVFLKEKGQEMKSEFYIPFVVDEAIKKEAIRVKVYESKEKWFGVTYPEDKESVVNSISEKIKQGDYPINLWKSE